MAAQWWWRHLWSVAGVTISAPPGRPAVVISHSSNSATRCRCIPDISSETIYFFSAHQVCIAMHLVFLSLQTSNNMYNLIKFFLCAIQICTEKQGKLKELCAIVKTLFLISIWQLSPIINWLNRAPNYFEKNIQQYFDKSIMHSPCPKVINFGHPDYTLYRYTPCKTWN